MLLSPSDPHRPKVRALRQRMVRNRLSHSQPTTNSVLDGILAPTVVPTLKLVGTSMFASIVPNNTKESHALVQWGLVLKNNDLFSPAQMKTLPKPTLMSRLLLTPLSLRIVR